MKKTTNDPKPREVAGFPLKCPVCSHDRFWKREAQLNTKTASMFGMDFTNPSGDCYICGNCRHILWFYGKFEKP